MKLAAQLFLFVIVVLAGFSFARADEKCGGCAELKNVTIKLSQLSELDKRGPDVIKEADQAIRAIPMQKGRKLNLNQIEVVTDLLAASEGNDPSYAIIENGIKIFKANEKAFFARFKKLNKKSAEYLYIGLSMKLVELESGRTE